MPQQLSFAQAEYAAKKKVARREQFLKEMEQVLPWSALQALIKPHYYREEERGRGHPPIGLERMLRMYLLQQWYNLADEALKDAIYDSNAFRHFLRIDLGRESVPDATTLLGFRHLLEAKGVQAQLLETINTLLRERGLLMNQGTLGRELHRCPLLDQEQRQRQSTGPGDASDTQGQPVVLRDEGAHWRGPALRTDP